MNTTQIIGPGKERPKLKVYESVDAYLKNQEGQAKAEERKEEELQTPTTTTPPQYFFLTKEMFDIALKRIKQDYKYNEVLHEVRWNDRIKTVNESNLYYITLINTVFKNQGIRTATQADLEEILKNKLLDLNETYEDSGIILRSLTQLNEYFAEQTSEQIAKLQGKKTADLQFPIYIPACDLELINDPHSPTKLGFKVLNSGIYAPILKSNAGRFSSSDIDPNTGLPTKLSDSGDRVLYTRYGGLCKLTLDKQLILNSCNDDLVNLYNCGRIICVKTNGDAE